MTQEPTGQDRAVYQDLRERLVDRSNRNRLLNFRHTTSASIIRIVDELPDRILAHLRDDHRFRFLSLRDPDAAPEDEQTPEFQAHLQRAMIEDSYRNAIDQIKPDDPMAATAYARLERSLRDQVRTSMKLPRRQRSKDIDPSKHARGLGIAPEYDLPRATEPVPSKHTDGFLQTLSFPDQLKARLAKIYRNCRAIEQETGVNTLHLAFGFLEWFESDSSDVALLSPLLVLPVNLERRTVRGGENEYRLGSIDSAPSSNLSLELRFREDFALRFPEFDADSSDPVEDYFDEVQRMIGMHPRWRVRRFLTLASFSFARIAMYRDLEPANWTSVGSPETHPLVRPILRGTSADPGAGIGTFAPEFDIDSPEIQKIAPLLVHDADSSQHSAIIDAVRGRSFVIEGPPGTGKSQTIANVIATAMHLGKTVLFVSEKMAALEVVKSRLDRIDLGDFCLTLHSAGAKPATVIEALRRRAERRAPTPRTAGAGQSQLAVAKDALGSHLAAIHSEIGPHRETAYTLIGQFTGIERQHPHFPTIFRKASISLPGTLDHDLVAAARQHLEALEDAAWPEDRPGWCAADSSFQVLEATGLFPDEQQDLLDRLGTIAAAIPGLANSASVLAEHLGETAPQSVEASEALWRRVESLSDPPPGDDLDLLARLADPDVAGQAIVLADVATETDEIRRCIEDAGISDPGTTEPAKLLVLADLTKALQISGTVGGLSTILSEVIALESFVAQNDPIITDLMILLGLDQVSVAGFADLSKASALAADADLDWYPYCRPGLQQHALALTEAAERQEKWYPIFRQLNEALTLPDMTATLARELARALKSAGWFGALRSDVRRANKQFLSHWRAGKIPRPSERIRHLEGAAGLLEERQALIETAVVRKIMPEPFDPFSTRLRPFALAASWQFRLADTLAGNSSENVRLRALLTEMGPARLARLAALSGPASRLHEFVEIGKFDPSASWIDVKDAISARASGIRTLTLAAKSLGLPDLVRLDGLRDTAALLQKWHDNRLKLESGVAKVIFGAQPPRISAIRSAAEFSIAVNRNFPAIARRLLEDRWGPTVQALRQASAAVGADTALLQASLESAKTLGLRPTMGQIHCQPFDSAVSAVAKLLAAKNDLPLYLRFAATRAECLANPLSAAVLQAHVASGVTLRHLPKALGWLVAWSLVRRTAESNRGVFSRSGVNLNVLRRNFAQADRAGLVNAAIEVAAAALRRRVPSGHSYGSKKEWTDGALLQNEFGKQRRYVPLRDLLSRAGGAVTALTPCVMMSPLTVAQYLQPGHLIFDLVVMDEASQIKPEDAIGALLRGRQTIIVGDPKQLPPTNFFDRALDDDAEEEESDDAGLQTGDKVVAESVLDLAVRSFQPARRLRWHYRSQHESLIAFSNREFYDDDLIVFPACSPPSATLGIEMVQIDGTWRARTNLEEARALSQAVLSFMRHYPKLSLGVVAMNQPQRELIQAEIDVLAATDPRAASYREQWEANLEPPFVKNLENVQGDERDVIFISLGWGRTLEGAFHQRFFPINRRDDGHRRLNVLFTRARRKLVIFSSLQPENIVVDPAKTARGVQVLRSYLLFARDGRLEAGLSSGRCADSPFEEAVAEALRVRGHNVELQIGVAGYFIDIGVRHPTKSANFILGIECDGATYHSAKSSRDRDRLRQDALERLGWRLVRVWSTDWFQNHGAEVDRLSAAITAAIAASEGDDATGIRLVDLPDTTQAAAIAKPGLREAAFELVSPEATKIARAPSAPKKSPEAPLFSYSDLPATLRRFRDEAIMAELPGSEPERCILRDEMISIFVQEKLDDPDEFTAKVPQYLRTRTDGRQMKYLGRICDLVERHSRPLR
jgi:very-short-patch-repair endonuclease